MLRSLALYSNILLMLRTNATSSVAWQCSCICCLSIFLTSKIWFTKFKMRWALCSIVSSDERRLGCFKSSLMAIALCRGDRMSVSGERMSWVALMRNFIFSSFNCRLARRL